MAVIQFSRTKIYYYFFSMSYIILILILILIIVYDRYKFFIRMFHRQRD